MLPVPQRFSGTLTQWKDDRGFGFITPVTGGDRIFVHISSFPRTTTRPFAGEEVTYEIETGHDGKRQARNVRSPRVEEPVAPAKPPRPYRPGFIGLLAIPLIAGLLVIANRTWGYPLTVPALYVGASILTFIAYASDKSAAARGTWRVSEKALILLGVFGGWPGAIVAQQVLRHKTKKVSFQVVFWVSVVVNILVLLAFSPPVAAFVHRLATGTL